MPQVPTTPGYSILGGRRAKRSTPKPSGEATTVFTQEQSFDQMRIVSLALLSRIASDRNLFPGIKYQIREYNHEDPDPSYRSFVDGSNSTVLFTEHNNNWKVLPYGARKEVDQLLNWLDGGVFDAMERGYLKKFQLTIHSNDGGKISSSNMLESYTMSFTYGLEPEIEFSDTNGRPETLAVAKKRVYQVVEDFRQNYRGVMTAPLPSSARLGMVLEYNKTRPHDYVAPSFRAGDDGTLAILKATGASSQPTLDLGFHGLALGCSVPSHLSSGSPASVASTNLRPNSADDLDFQAWPTRHFDKSHRNRRISSSNQKRITRSVRQPSSVLRESQYENIEQMRQWQIHRSNDDLRHDTQPLSSPSLIAGRPIRGLLPYIPDVIDSIYKARVQRRVRGVGDKLGVACGCESIDEAGGLIKCEICGCFQHYPCYGYASVVYKTHVCYRCLDSSTRDSSQHHIDMVEMCVTRRVLFYLEELARAEELLSIEKLSEHLACDDYSADLVLDRLVENRFITLYRRRSQIDNFQFLLNRDNYSRYMHPEMGIENYLSNHGDSEEVASRVQSVSSLSRARSNHADHGPPSLSDAGSPGYEEVSRIDEPSPGRSSSTVSDGFLSSPDVNLDIASSTTRQLRSKITAYSPPKSWERKRRSQISTKYSGNKKARTKL